MSPKVTWTFDPGAIIAVALFGYIYARRWADVRAEHGPRAASGWRLTLFMLGLGAVLVALVTPVDSLGHQMIFMHMVQHLLLIDVAPILLILGLTKVLMRPVTRHLQPLERSAGFLASPWFAVVFYIVAMCVWHVPVLYDAAARHDGLHVLEHVTFLTAGVLYWWHLVSPIRSRLRLGGMGPVTYMLVTKLFVGFLGIVLAFAPSSLYGYYDHQPAYWGLSPKTDQSVAGLAMALEQSIVMGIALAWLFARMLGESEREEKRAERYA